MVTTRNWIAAAVAAVAFVMELGGTSRASGLTQYDNMGSACSVAQ